MKPFGLVLAGGGTKGAYQVGVYKAINELKIPVSAITGTSIGAINGAVFAQGSLDIAFEIWRHMAAKHVFNTKAPISKSLFDPKQFFPLLHEIITNNGLDVSPLKSMLEKIVDEEKIRRARIEFGLSTFSLSDFQPIELFIEDIPKGFLVDYILASACFPGIKGAKIENKTFIDGGVSNNMPVSMLIEKGIKDIIAVDVGGIGIIKNYDCEALNIITIQPKIPLANLFDFDTTEIERNINLGYYDTLRVFGRASGRIYYFPPREYDKLNMMFSADVIEGLEEAAQFYGMKIDIIYTAKSFLSSLFDLQSEVYSKFEKVRNSFLHKHIVRDVTSQKIVLEPKIKIPLICDTLEGKLLGKATNKIIKVFMPKEYLAANALLVMKRRY